MGFIAGKITAAFIYLSWAKKLWVSRGKTAYLLGTPVHDNIGDSAIAIAEKEFLLKNGYDSVIEITTPDIWEYGKCIGRLLPKDAAVYLHGGGNMGDLYVSEEELRRKIIRECHGQPMVIFPQTIYYSDTNGGKEAEAESTEIYGQKDRLTIVAREETSYETMKRLYPKADILLTPDIVLSLNLPNKGYRRSGILLCFRNDSEMAISENGRNALSELLRMVTEPVETTDMISEKLISLDIRDQVVNSRWERFSKVKLVITDRLHGMVFAAITGTPCIVFSNYNHKVRGTYEWIKYLPYIRFAETVYDVKACLSEMLAMENCVYDNTSLMPHFEKLAQIVREYASKAP